MKFLRILMIGVTLAVSSITGLSLYKDFFNSSPEMGIAELKSTTNIMPSPAEGEVKILETRPGNNLVIGTVDEFAFTAQLTRENRNVFGGRVHRLGIFRDGELVYKYDDGLVQMPADRRVSAAMMVIEDYFREIKDVSQYCHIKIHDTKWPDFSRHLVDNLKETYDIK